LELSRLSGTDALPLKIVTFSEDLPHPGVHHTSTVFRAAPGTGDVPANPGDWQP
jgi:hypothetical protein